MNDCQSSVTPFLAGLIAQAKKERFPLRATFELTPLCNLNCVMCYVHLTPEQMKQQGSLLSVEQWLSFAEQSKKLGTLCVTLTGGEALTYPGFWELYRELNRMGFLITLLTNGCLVNEEAIERFRAYGMPYQVRMTLYGACDETYAATCGVPHGFSDADRAIRLMVDNEVPLWLTTTVVRQNSADLQAMMQYAAQHHLKLQYATGVLKSARGAQTHAETARYLPSDFQEHWRAEQLEKTRLSGKQLGDPFARCSNYRNAYWMAWNGRMLHCSFMPQIFSNALRMPLAQAWSELQDKLDSMKNPAECGDCKYAPFCLRCPGLLATENGGPDQINPTFCREAEIMYQYSLK